MDQAPGALSVAESIRQTLHAAMTADPSVLLLGESVGHLGGVFRTTQGLLEHFGAERVIQTPLSENATVGLAIGLAMAGKRPVVELVGAQQVPSRKLPASWPSSTAPSSHFPSCCASLWASFLVACTPTPWLAHCSAWTDSAFTAPAPQAKRPMCSHRRSRATAPASFWSP